MQTDQSYSSHLNALNVSGMVFHNKKQLLVKFKGKIIQFSQNMPSICIPEKILNLFLKTSWKHLLVYVKGFQVPGSENYKQFLHHLNI